MAEKGTSAVDFAADTLVAEVEKRFSHRSRGADNVIRKLFRKALRNARKAGIARAAQVIEDHGDFMLGDAKEIADYIREEAKP